MNKNYQKSNPQGPKSNEVSAPAQPLAQTAPPTVAPRSTAGEISTAERSVVNGYKVVTRRCPSAIEKQDEMINSFELEGYRHYESIPIFGNEILLRFRKGE